MDKTIKRRTESGLNITGIETLYPSNENSLFSISITETYISYTLLAPSHSLLRP
jgi:hypothetical protein